MAREQAEDRLILLLTDAPGADAEAAIEAGLSNYNEEHAGYVDARTLAVLVKDPASLQVVGGLIGRTTLGIFFIDLIFLPPSARGEGAGRRILAMAEEEAKRRGCTAAALYTITFQAPAFYARQGYRELGRIACSPPG
ncbi:MAG: GNAT family N-acetyltransferase, partial [Devosia sp.]|nr:GNAT family N-acetyltransferase [Devosia sp.]